jgi:hydrogenase maturation protease
MNQTLVDQIARAVLYEGYILYPYRPSVKNRQRWTFGGLYPEWYSRARGGNDPCAVRTECLVVGGPRTGLRVTVRFLHLVARQVGELVPPVAELPPGREPAFGPVESLTVGGTPWHTWEEAVERTVEFGDYPLEELAARPLERRLTFPARREWEPLRGAGGEVVGVVVRRQQALEGSIELAAEPLEERLFKVRVSVHNRTPPGGDGEVGRDEAVLRALVSTHTVLGVRGGEFVSLLDPPEDCRAAAAGCRNEGAWPVLVGEPGERDTMLSSPIILYDYPRVAPESPGDLFDATEIDEILTLRILTLTDEERRHVAAVDERARALLSRTEALAREQLLGLHGAVRGLRPVPGEDDHA